MFVCLSVSVQNESEAQPEETPPHTSHDQIPVELNEVVCGVETTEGMYPYIVGILDIYRWISHCNLRLHVTHIYNQVLFNFITSVPL